MRNYRTILLRFVAIVLFVVFWSCSSQKRLSAPLAVGDRNVTILAVNDMHAAVECFPRFAFMVDSLRNIYPDLLLFSAGDNQTGDPLSDQYSPKGLPMIELMNAVDFDLSAVGNHEFDTGAEGFALLDSLAHFDFLCANLETPNDLNFHIKPYKIINLNNGLKLGIVSLLQINNKGIPDCHPKMAERYKFSDPFIVAKKYTNMKDSCNVVLFVNHMGVENDYPLAAQLPKGKVDVIIGGHSHTKIADEEFHNGILYTQAEKKLRHASLIQIKVAPDGTVKSGMRLLTVGSKGNEKKSVRALLDSLRQTKSSLYEAIAAVEAPFNKDQLGYLMADALFSIEPVDIALVNKGGVRLENFHEKHFTINDVYQLDPFGNELVVIDLTGSELYDFYRAAYYADDYKIVYSAGLKSKYKLKNGELVDLQLFTMDDKPLDLNKTYKVSMNTYLLSATKFQHKDPGTNMFVVIADRMVEYLRNIKTVKSYQNEKRVTIDIEN